MLEFTNEALKHALQELLSAYSNSLDPGDRHNHPDFIPRDVFVDPSSNTLDHPSLQKFTNILRNITDVHSLHLVAQIAPGKFHFQRPQLRRRRKRSTHQFSTSSISLLESNHLYQLESFSSQSRAYRNRNQAVLVAPPPVNSKFLKPALHSDLLSSSSHDSSSLKVQQRVRRSVQADPNIPIQQLETYFKPADDPEWSKMWYMNRFEHAGGRHHLNITAAWAMGYSGRGVTVTILDDGVERDHPDLATNYYAPASSDFNSNDADPMPRYNPQNENRHGTRCAGEVAAVKDNKICVPGIAYNAQIGGIRMLDGDVTDVVEFKSVSHKPQVVDIYSSSWGPDDDGKTVDGPGKLTKQAFIDGTEKGRDGKGSIFVWASGNGGRYHDSCSCDGYCNSIYTITVSSTTENENIAWYSEKCSSTLAATYSSGTRPERNIVTTDLRHGCTPSHTGTSASAPIAAAMIALALEANPSLTWRDVQHIIVRSSNPTVVEKSGNFITNGAGMRVSHSYGFGLMDAGRMCELAKHWKQVAPMLRAGKVLFEGKVDWTGHEITRDFEIEEKVDGVDLSKIKLETVTAVITCDHQYRGMLEMFLTSPAGTVSQLLFKRQNDRSTRGFQKWEFMSVMHWDEQAAGTWVISIKNGGSVLTQKGVFKYFELKFTGTDPSWKLEEPVKDTEADVKVEEALQVDNDVSSASEKKATEKSSDSSTSSTTTTTTATTTTTTVAPLPVHCEKGLSASECSKCKDTFFLKNKLCVADCGSGFAAQREPVAFCEPCHPDCVDCFGSLKTECKSCKENRVLTAINTCEDLPKPKTPESTTLAAKPESEPQYVSSIGAEEVLTEASEQVVPTPQSPELPPTQPTESLQDYNRLRSQLTNLIAQDKEDSIQNILFQCILVVFVIIVLLVVLSKFGLIPKAMSRKNSGYKLLTTDEQTSRR